MRRALRLLFAGALLATACRGGAGEAGALRLDSKFGDGGRVVVALSKRNDLPHDAALQPDGKLVVGGMVGEEFGVSRFDVSGSLDPTFGQGGKARLVVGRSLIASNAIEAVAVQPDGKIVGAGRIESLTFTVVRFGRGGRLDRTFGTRGRANLPVGPRGDSGGTAYGLAVDQRGRIVVTGVAVNGAFLARLGPNGRLDGTFGGDGLVWVKRGLYSGKRPGPPLIERDGSIVVPVSDNLGSGRGVTLRRYRDDGKRDLGLGRPPADLLRWARSIARDSAGGFFVAGYFEGDQAKCKEICAVPAVVRFSPDGAVDSEFGKSGRVVVAPEAADWNSFAVGARGDVVVAATSVVLEPSVSDFLVRPLTRTGAARETTTDMASGRLDGEEVRTVLVRPDGRVIVVGAIEKRVDEDGQVLFSVALAQYRH
jgi:uncharacterized delta-60 repeat protein